MIALLLAAGETPDTTTAPADAAPAPAPVELPAPTRVKTPPIDRLPDGVFEGPMDGAGDGMTMHLTVVHGLVTRFDVRRPSGTFTLKPNGAPYDTKLRFGGREEDQFVKVSGEFWDPERAFGRFEGTLDKTRVQGTWRLTRR